MVSDEEDLAADAEVAGEEQRASVDPIIVTTTTAITIIVQLGIIIIPIFKGREEEDLDRGAILKLLKLLNLVGNHPHNSNRMLRKGQIKVTPKKTGTRWAKTSKCNSRFHQKLQHSQFPSKVAALLCGSQ
mmetsp:Transcript_23121/g.32307  ORF Transcript_23121/g.32307 Transcript_23121/m.32307 type:complete len:130 (-) Transcript_23121:293-682(-)